MKPVMVVAAGLARFDLRRYLVGALLWMPFSVLPLLGGVLLQQLFDRYAVSPQSALWLCVAFVGVEVVRGVSMVVAWTYGDWWWCAAATLLRTNVLRSVLTARGPAATRLPGSSGEAVARLRDDAADAVELVDEVVGLVGSALFTTAALVIMATIDPVITVVLVVPMIVVGVLSRLMRRTIHRLHLRARVLGAATTAFVGEIFGAVLALKTAGAEEAALRRLRELNARRRDAAIKDRLATDLMDTATGATVEISIGLVLLLGAAAMRRGEFTVGDLALFTSYVSWLTALPRTVGAILYRLPQAAVATERLGRLMAAHENAHDLAARTPTFTPRKPIPPTIPARGQTASGRLEVLEAWGLSVPGRLEGVSLRVERGSFTVITGAVGAGKSTLVRALLGLQPVTAGTVAWNGEPVDDPGTFLVPGRVAYAGQVPRLFSETLRENVLLGWPGTDAHVERALELAAFDLAEVEDALDTVVGPRGVRLSGGQVQRATAARALVRTPELLVVDDLSSALDVGTERLLWERIAADGPSTLLVVSHRRAVLDRADQIVVLYRGTVAGRGKPGDLLDTCPEMRRLWQEEDQERGGSSCS
ncbi:ATP-binding cassette domain-containing protein [Nonomuraea sp. NPDC050556]|uniref:ATP-binding cassette domain-containing protein n=1 Tax=Nonomuraea sp. NPDC050556 TaxID=3364369 RepID=UPI00379CD7AB